MTATPQLLNLATNESGFAFDSVSGASYQFSELALEIIEWIKGGLDADQIRNRIVEGRCLARARPQTESL